MTKGFSLLLLIILISIITLSSVLIYINYSRLTHIIPSAKTYKKIVRENQVDNTKEVSWKYDMNSKSWQVIGTPPECPESLSFPPPVDLDLVSGILYPGQLRGGDYKPHGGFRFDNRVTNDIEVRAIMDGYILKAARYDDGIAVQDLLFYVNECGIMVMHDHLLTLSPKLEEIFSKLPVGKNGDSRTTEILPRVYIKKGEVLATEIGYENFPGGYENKNIFVDFGLYDLRKTNGIEYDSVFRLKNPNVDEYGTTALCWFDYLGSEKANIIRNLPTSGKEGTISDYCN